MYRLLIVDDEEIITDGLYEVFSSYNPEQLDVYKAYSATEALEWLARSRIDIILTDIAMPGMNGLELIEKVQNFWPKCKVVFLTGHNNFEYTYRAIQMTNVRYLLKTEGYDKIIDTVEVVMNEIYQEKFTSKWIERSREQLYAYQFMAQGEYMRHLLQDSKYLGKDMEILRNEFNELEISLDLNKGVWLVLGRLTYPKGKTYLEKSNILSAVRDMWEYHLSEKLQSMDIIDKYGDILWFIQPCLDTNDDLDGRFSKYLEGSLELVQQESIHLLELPIIFTVSSHSCQWNRITEKYEQLRQLQQFKVGRNIPMIIWDTHNEQNQKSPADKTTQKYRMESMVANLDSNKIEEFFIHLQTFITSEIATDDVHQLMEAYYAIALSLYSYINRLELNTHIFNYDKLLRIDDHRSIMDGFHFLKDTTEKILHIHKIRERDKASCIIENICKYIEDHLNEDLSLVKLAEIHFFNPSYLSYFFKQEYGMNLSEYIEKCRILKAKELLENRKLKIRDVGVAVGYASAHSFTRFFKKVTGMTPKEYRGNLIRK
ncbi:response regulator transcription factor [Gracilibacillus dipsosauri]|uniref:DNA-binding response regulator n=2 Tax=Gracilibacillus TaxID=74385 RepID=A0A317KVP1_9BACI|nr:response regulator [Gracilibacillus dipsosauri]PWU67254.1 DNA-binding response regulator [Gracilibacillus dipsosauri]